jgi:nicotinate-nucleotide adenylyltransferase
VDERELRRAAPSYTYDTLTELKRERPGDVLVLVLGLDAFLGLPGWHRWHELLDLAHIAVAQRPGWDLQTGSALTEALRARQVQSVSELFATSAGRILLQPVTPLEISSTQVRTTAAEGGDLHYLVPETVRRLIQDSHCYA